MYVHIYIYGELVQLLAEELILKKYNITERSMNIYNLFNNKFSPFCIRFAHILNKSDLS